MNVCHCKDAFVVEERKSSHDSGGRVLCADKPKMAARDITPETTVSYFMLPTRLPALLYFTSIACATVLIMQFPHCFSLNAHKLQL